MLHPVRATASQPARRDRRDRMPPASVRLPGHPLPLTAPAGLRQRIDHRAARRDRGAAGQRQRNGALHIGAFPQTATNVVAIAHCRCEPGNGIMALAYQIHFRQRRGQPCPCKRRRPVTVRSTTDNSDPSRSPDMVCTSSGLRRVAASISIVSPPSRRGRCRRSGCLSA